MDMQIDPTGAFVIQAGETITITVTARNTAYLAAFPDKPSCTQWSSIQGPDGQEPGPIVESRQFVAPASGSKCSVSIPFDFKPDGTGAYPQGAKYDIKIEGPVSGSFNDLPVKPPPVDNRTYDFAVA